ncbi:helix-turn-helix domain-containing protein [Marinagarivorans cellulosilyticus]|uniref:HTH araC/xylS-type domain-containing protein n=1 Tax=Marinagarivorans cellulosilyticus TaxID=2721545 RepID=A0AAN1WJ97_9GAMM|nr:helix-turn-helix domain-containing protein [Marinagarivorans cellulosilyticus]BCD98635.1 hypothetical protein MARGE09_P2836 [Marinagarivorans cellulosilyticus]
MYKFYKTALYSGVALFAISLVGLCVGYKASYISAKLNVGSDSDIPWSPITEQIDAAQGSVLQLKPNSEFIEYESYLPATQEFPYTAYTFKFGNDGNTDSAIDLTPYDSIDFNITCTPQNVLLFNVFTHDPEITLPQQNPTQRVNSTFFSCDASWQLIKIRLASLVTPVWWFNEYRLELSKQAYDLTRAYRFSIVNSLQSPRDTQLDIKIKDVRLSGRKRQYFYFTLAATALLWLVFAFWVIKRYVYFLTLDLREKVKKDRQIIAYKELTINPQKNKEVSDVLRFMATEYASPEISLDMACGKLGINRTKINEILKTELSLTFNTYLNKLRITEAARLLTKNKSATIAEIAYSVGYNNVSYFSKLFKAEYGCTPKTFKQLYD